MTVINNTELLIINSFYTLQFTLRTKMKYMFNKSGNIINHKK